MYPIFPKSPSETSKTITTNKLSLIARCGIGEINEEGQESSKYRSTRGHKINHSFARLNTRLSYYDSARFGIVMSIVSREGINIPKDAELLTHYGYDYSTGPRWYKKLFHDFLFGKENSATIYRGRVKSCYFVDDMSDNSHRCENYLRDIKNQLLLNANITSDKDVSNEQLDSILRQLHIHI